MPTRLRTLALLALLLAAPVAGAQASPLAGTWRTVQQGQVIEITLAPDGRFARRDTGPDGQGMSVSGHWTLHGQDAWLRLTIEDWAPRRACGLLGCTPIRMIPGETYRYVLQGGDLLMLEDTGGRITLRRAG